MEEEVVVVVAEVPAAAVCARCVMGWCSCSGAACGRVGLQLLGAAPLPVPARRVACSLVLAWPITWLAAPVIYVSYLLCVYRVVYVGTCACVTCAAVGRRTLPVSRGRR